MTAAADRRGADRPPAPRTAGPAAFRHASRRRSDLARRTQHGLGRNLAVVVERTDLGTMAFELLDWAAARGQLPALLAAAAADNPDNPRLRAWLAGLGAGEGATG